MSTRLMRFLARGLLAAMLLAVLAPAISRGLASTRGVGDWVEICTSGGMRWVQVEAPGTGADPLSADDLLHALDHCGHCGLAAERFAPLLPTLPVVASLHPHWPTPRHTASAPASRVAPSPAARGPPLLA